MENRERKGHDTGRHWVVWAALLMPGLFCVAHAPLSTSQMPERAEQQRTNAGKLPQQGQVRAAIEEYRRAVAANPHDPQNYYGLAVALDRAGDLREEREALHHVLLLNPSYAPLHNQLGLLNMKEAKPAMAAAEFRAALALDPLYPEAKNNLGVLMRAQGDNAAAEALFSCPFPNTLPFVMSRIQGDPR